MKFQELCSEIANTELWRLFEEKAANDHKFISAVEDICYEGVTLSRDVIRFFPTFTLHDGTHLAGVCRWMIRLLGDSKDELTAEEVAILLMSACCHDMGMSVSDKQKAELEKELAAGDYTEEWLKYFRDYPADELEYNKNHSISGEMLRKYIRRNHSRRIAEQLTDHWPPELTERGIHRKVLIRICESHGNSLSDFRDLMPASNCDLNMCSVLLRLADALDYDAARAPERLFRQLGLDHPETEEQKKSRSEWENNRSGKFGEIRDGVIPYTARFDNPQIEYNVLGYIRWLNEEISECRDFLSRFSDRWNELRLPYKIVGYFDRGGLYEAGEFCLTMDQDRIIELLAGQNLYYDPGVFVRELLQNAVDAILTRREVDPLFGENEGKIIVHTWVDNEGFGWFRIEDNGIGMDKHILRDYLLKVGCSYYTSDEYKAVMLHKVRKTDFTPISRFGIGLLSCFMNDPDNSQVEIITRRSPFETGSRNPVYQLNIDSLHGHYFLTEIKKGIPRQPIHHPPGRENEEDGYRHPVGTTICVRVNMYCLGGLKAFNELMDKYVCFPEIPVEFHHSEGIYIYPTRQELMDSVHRLNPGGPNGEVQKHFHPISDEIYSRIKREMPYMEWDDGHKPMLVLQYYPLDWLSGTESVSGVAVRTDVIASVKCEPLKYQGKEFFSKFKTYAVADYSQNILVLAFENEFSFSWQDEIKRKNLEFIDAHQGRMRINISYKNMLSMLSQEEAQLLRKLFVRSASFISSIEGDDDKGVSTFMAYNGILADTSSLLGEDDSYVNITVLLSEGNYPTVNLARNMIMDLPLETSCNLVRMNREIPRLSYDRLGTLEPFTVKKFALITEERFDDILSCHPEWEDEIWTYIAYRHQVACFFSKIEENTIFINENSIGEHKIELEQIKQRLKDMHFYSELEKDVQKDLELDIMGFRNNLYDYLCLTILKRNFAVYKNFKNKSLILSFALKHDTSDNIKFPVELFFYPTEKNSPLCVIMQGVYINYYNQEHVFSQWLIEKREELQEKVPGIYSSMLTTMILETQAGVIISSINTILDKLKNFQGNPFGVDDRLYLSESDFTVL